MPVFRDRLIVYFLIAGLAVLLAGLVWLWRSRRRLTPKGLDTSTTTVGEWTWRYHVSGRGPDLLLLHGLGANLFCWSLLVPLLRSRFRVWVPDLPGFGGTTKVSTATYGLDEQCDRVRDFLDAHKIETCFVVGNSMGGNIALWLARRFPTRIKGVIVIAPAASPSLMPLNLGRWSWLAAPLSMGVNRPLIRYIHGRIVSRRDRIDPARIEESLRTYARRPDAVKTFLRATAAIRDPRLPGGLTGLKTPVHLLWGSADRLVSKKVMEDLKVALPEALSAFHEGGGHHLQEDDPDWVARHIVEFFKNSPDLSP